MDIFDRATEREEQMREAALQAQQQRAAIQYGDWRELSAKWCESAACGERIPDARRRAIPGVAHCVECAARIEQQQRGRRR